MLLGVDVLQRVYTLRHMVGHLAETDELDYAGASEQLLSQFHQYDNNEDFLNRLNVSANNYARSYER